MKTILCFTVLAVVLSFCNTAPTERELQLMFERFVKECKRDERATTEDIIAYTKDKVPETKEGKCFVGCMFEKMGIIVNGTFSRVVADKMAYDDFPDNPQKIEAAKKIFKLCESEIGASSNRCVTGPALLVCIEKYDKKA